jgi:hypothetical protein
MKMLWARRASFAKYTPHPGGRMPVAAWDVLRMLGVAVVAGFAISIVAAGLTLLLAGEAEAAPAGNEAVVAHLAGPGVLLAGIGCDSVPVQASERDWMVRIDRTRATVRVMQTFLLPAESEGAAVFAAVLPAGAKLLSLQLQTVEGDFEARIMPAGRYDALDADGYREATRNAVVASVAKSGEITTSLLPGLSENQVVTLSYTYATSLRASDGQYRLSLPLTETRLANLEALFGDDPSAPRESGAVNGTVWVEWTGSKPRRIGGHPAGTQVETDSGLVEALSWESAGLQPGARFSVAWSM